MKTAIAFPGPIAPPPRRKGRRHFSATQLQIVAALKRSNEMFPFDYNGPQQCVYWAANKLNLDIQMHKLASGGWRIWSLGKKTQ